MLPASEEIQRYAHLLCSSWAASMPDAPTLRNFSTHDTLSSRPRKDLLPASPPVPMEKRSTNLALTCKQEHSLQLHDNLSCKMESWPGCLQLNWVSDHESISA